MGEVKKIKINNFEIGGNELTILAGPCVIEDEKMVMDTAENLKKIAIINL